MELKSALESCILVCWSSSKQDSSADLGLGPVIWSSNLHWNLAFLVGGSSKVQDSSADLCCGSSNMHWNLAFVWSAGAQQYQIPVLSWAWGLRFEAQICIGILRFGYAGAHLCKIPVLIWALGVQLCIGILRFCLQEQPLVTQTIFDGS